MKKKKHSTYFRAALFFNDGTSEWLRDEDLYIYTTERSDNVCIQEVIDEMQKMIDDHYMWGKITHWKVIEYGPVKIYNIDDRTGTETQT